ncbi:MAG: DNA methyltransferase, partial [Pseudomonadota bacterium]
MTPQAFVQKWKASQLKERSASQEHFIDLCRLIGQPTPAESDPDGSWYTFERGARKTGGGEGWADVWKKGCFAWEYKGKHKDLTAAFAQLQRYAIALENPPLLVVSDMETIVIHSNFTNTVQEIHTIALEDIGAQENLQKLRWLFSDAEQFRPSRTTFAVTEEAAQRMGEVAKRLTGRGEAPQTVAHFLIQCVFCMFAEDAGLLPQKLFETVLDKSNPDGTKAQSRLAALFQAMQGGGDFALENIPWFNGGLFKEIAVPRLETADVVALLDAARMNWSAIEPAILGTLFERGLNPDMRSQLGAHYTDPATILKLIHPVIEAPLLAEWQAAHHKIAAAMEKYQQGGKGSQAAHKEAHAAFIGYLEHLKAYRVLDPACGSGNFLYLALKTLKDLEHRANLEAEALGLQRQIGIETGPANVLGIELNPYAAELARVTVWIGELQWMLGHGYPVLRDPILRPLDHIEQRDAVLERQSPHPNPPPLAGEGANDKVDRYVEPEWPEVDVIVGNPPFLGDKKMRGELGDEYTDALRDLYKGRVPGGADLVTYWFEKARAHIEQGKAKRAGLVATNSIRGGASRKVLERIVQNNRPSPLPPLPLAGEGWVGGGLTIFEAWSDEEWINQGAAVRVSLVCFGASSPSTFGGGVGVGENIATPKPPLPETTKKFARA